MIKTIFNKFLIIIILFLTLTLYTGCNNKKNDYINAPIAIVYQNNKPYIINQNGDLFDLSKYDSIVPYFDDILIVKKDNLFGYIKNTGEPLTEIIYESAYPFKENKAVVSIDNHCYIINEKAEVIYTFEDTVFSSSSFSENLLVITKDKKQGYLKYNEENDTFNYLITEPSNADTSLLESNMIYDYCGEFLGGYAVVGNLNANNELKYTHINTSGERLYNLEWDSASNFSNGYAVVGNYTEYTVKVYCSDDSKFDERTTTEAVTIGYMYVSPTGKYLGTPTIFTETIVTTDPETGEEITETIEVDGIEPYVFAMAKDFENDVALVANLYYYVSNYNRYHIYDLTENKYFYNYYFIDTKGTLLFGLDAVGKNHISQNNWGNGSMYNDIFNIDNYHIVTYCSSSWKIQYTEIGTYKPNSSFANITFDLKKVKLTQDDPEDMSLNEKLIQKFPWINSYLDKFTSGKQTASYVVDHVIAPYQLSSFKDSKYINTVVAKAQSYSGIKDTTGLIGIISTDEGLELTYIIPPLYEDIIF